MSWVMLTLSEGQRREQSVMRGYNRPDLVEAASGGVLLVGPELLQLRVQDVHELLHQPHGGADVPCKHGALRVPSQLIG